MDVLLQAVLGLAGSEWVYLVVFALTVADAFLVIVPSETVVIGLAALSASTGSPVLGILIPVAAVAAMLGDSLTYYVGRRIGLDRFAFGRRPRISAAIDWARTALERRAAVVLLTARFVPFGRVAVNLTAGATGFSYRRFLPLTVLAGSAWAGYNVLIGAAFGAWFHDNPLLAIVLSIAVAISAGVLVDFVSARIARFRAR